MPGAADSTVMPNAGGLGLVDRVYREILGSIIAGEFREGDKLPTEQALTERYAASRPTIREALSRLRADGITQTRQGSGTVVQRRPDPQMPRFTPLETLSDVQRCFEFRIAVESGAAALAAAKASHADIAEIEHQLRNLDTVIAEHGLGAREDFAFHQAMARASRNPFFISAIAQMQQQVLASMNLMRNLSLLKSTQRQELVQAEHAAIVAAVKARNPAAAQQAMRSHIENARDRMFGH